MVMLAASRSPAWLPCHGPSLPVGATLGSPGEELIADESRSSLFPSTTPFVEQARIFFLESSDDGHRNRSYWSPPHSCRCLVGPSNAGHDDVAACHPNSPRGRGANPRLVLGDKTRRWHPAPENRASAIRKKEFPLLLLPVDPILPWSIVASVRRQSAAGRRPDFQSG